MIFFHCFFFINGNIGQSNLDKGAYDDSDTGYGANIGAGSTGFAGGTLSQISGGMNGVSIGIQSTVNYNSLTNGAMPNINPQYAGSVAVGPYANTGGVASLGMGALWGFLGFYVSCLAITWFVYARPVGLLHATERQLRLQPAQ